MPWWFFLWNYFVALSPSTAQLGAFGFDFRSLTVGSILSLVGGYLFGGSTVTFRRGGYTVGSFLFLNGVDDPWRH
jgi:hypothetical protein